MEVPPRSHQLLEMLQMPAKIDDSMLLVQLRHRSCVQIRELVERDGAFRGVPRVRDVVDVLPHDDLPVVGRLRRADALEQVEGELRKLVRELGRQGLGLEDPGGKNCS